MSKSLKILLILLGVLALVVSAFIGTALLFFTTISSSSSASACENPGNNRVSSAQATVDATGVRLRGEPLDNEQLGVVEEIIGQGKKRNLSYRDIKMALMTGAQESGLRNLDYGDRDSLGVYQQRPSSGWGTPDQIRHVPYAVSKFYDALEAVQNRPSKSMFDIIVYEVQRPDPDAYRSPDNNFMGWEPLAEALLNGVAEDSVVSSVMHLQDFCRGNVVNANAVFSSEGWTFPLVADYYVSSQYGMRFHPVYKRYSLHDGTDFAGPDTGSPVLAVNSGVVISAGLTTGYGNYVVINHGNGIVVGYAHLNSISVSANQPVESGQKVGELGSTGYSTGPHLHLNVKKNGSWIDPMPWLRSLGLNP